MKRCVLVALSVLCVAGCKKTPPEPESTAYAESQATASSGGTAAQTASSPGEPKGAGGVSPAPASAPATTPAASVPVSPDDPLKGQFTLADATKGLTGTGKLVAELQTDKGKLECELFDDKAPITVANFVGLARGVRPWKNPSGEWVKKPAYDGTTFHRVIKGFMIQGGDARGNGSGEPGYVIPDEIWPGAKHDQRGLLCMANRGKNTNGAQFFITDAPAKHLDGGYTIFGKCTPDSVIEAIASVEVSGDRAVTPPKITKVTIKRKAK